MKICDICQKMKPDTESYPSTREGGQPVIICSDCAREGTPCPGCDTLQFGNFKRTLYAHSADLVCPACQEREYVTMFARKVHLHRPGGPRLGVV